MVSLAPGIPAYEGNRRWERAAPNSLAHGGGRFGAVGDSSITDAAILSPTLIFVNIILILFISTLILLRWMPMQPFRYENLTLEMPGSSGSG
jgi:hypothetical protein